MRALLLGFFLAALPAFAQQGIEEARRTIAAIEQALKQRPQDPALWFYLAASQARAGDKGAALASLEKTLAYGEGFVPPPTLGFETIWEDPAFQALRKRMEAGLPRLDHAPAAFELEDRTLIPEGIAYDPGTATFLVGSIAQRKIVRVAPGGIVYEFAGAAARLDHVLGLALDSPRRILYAVSTTALTEAGEKQRRNEVVAFDADKGSVLRRVLVPDATQLNDVAVARGGRVFASDSGSGAIFEIQAIGPARLVVPPGQLPGSNGLAVSPDVKHLYVAHSTGIAVVDIATGKCNRLAVPARENFAAIDGLYEWQGQLVGVQNVTNPGRVILISLSPDGSTITRVQTLLSHHHPSLDEPTTGAVTTHGFYLLAATAVSRYNRQGVIERPESMPKPTVLRIPLPR